MLTADVKPPGTDGSEALCSWQWLWLMVMVKVRVTHLQHPFNPPPLPIYVLSGRGRVDGKEFALFVVNFHAIRQLIGTSRHTGGGGGYGLGPKVVQEHVTPRSRGRVVKVEGPLPASEATAW